MAKYQKGTFIVVPNKHVLSGMKAEYQSVYLWICNFSDENGVCFPSRTTLANHAGCSVRMVDYAIKEFEEKGLLEKTIRKSGKENISSLYQLMIIERGVVHGMHYPSAPGAVGSVENDTVTQPINSTLLTSSETEVSQKEEIPSFEDYMYSLGYEPYEFERDDYLYQTYRHSTGNIITPNSVKSFQKKYNEQYKKNGIESIVQPKKVVKPIDQVFYIFSDNPASVRWYSNKTQRDSAEELLKVMGLEQIKQLYEFAQSIKGHKNAPEIDTPYEMLNKMIKLKNFYNKGGNVGVI